MQVVLADQIQEMFQDMWKSIFFTCSCIYLKKHTTTITYPTSFYFVKSQCIFKKWLRKYFRAVCAKFKYFVILFLVFSRSIHNQMVEVKLAFPSSNPPLRSSLSSSLGWELPGSAISSSKPRCRGKSAKWPRAKKKTKIFCEDIRLTLKRNVSKNHHLSLVCFFLSLVTYI